MLRFLVFFSALICFAGCAQFRPVDTEKALLHLRVGTSLLEAGNYPQALTELLKAQEEDPTNPTVQNHLGLVYFARDRYDLAEKHIRNAIKLKPDYTDAKNNLGRILIERQQYPEAEKLLKESLADLTFPSPEKPYLNLGLLTFRQQKYREAKSYLTKSLDYQRNNCMGQTLYGRTLFEMKDFSASAAALDRAIGFCQGEQDEPQYYSALAYYQLGDTKKAETRLEEIVRIYQSGKYRDRARSMLETMRR